MKSTTRVELVETDAIVKALNRLCDSKNKASWKAALHHAASISGIGTYYTKRIREALELP